MEYAAPWLHLGKRVSRLWARALTTPSADPLAPVSQARLYMNEATHRLTLAAPSSGWLLTAGKCSSKRLSDPTRSAFAITFKVGDCRALITPLNSAPAALMQRSAGAVSRASASQITALGRVLGSNISSR